MSVDPMCYEAQFFGFTPQTCAYRVYVALEGYLFEAMLVVEKVILKKLEGFPSCKISQFDVRQSTEKYLCFMNDCFNQLFGKLEYVLLNLLRIPKNALLPGDKVHEQYPYSKEQVELLQKETEQLHQKCKDEALAKQALLAELEEQKEVQAELEKILKWFDGLDNICRENGTSDLKGSLTVMAETSRRLKQKQEEVDTKSKRLKSNDSSSSHIGMRTRQQRQESKK
ncbi:protein MIS12 homolog [Ambystoma mexicanum]|uniref:protein MIS12 homolog n=1 Tax=Ambystoma mexicanum TaxID=8296 RepID=UPI0037E78199